MKVTLYAGMFALVLSGAAPLALAGDPNPDQCLECHEPTEDWAGLTIDEIMVKAKDPDNKRHQNNQSLSDEQLRLIINALVPIDPTDPED